MPTERDIGREILEGIRELKRRESHHVEAKTAYSDEPLGSFEVIRDFLPSPEELAFKEETVKVTITLSKSSVEFFKREAEKHDTKYQQMIRRLLDEYTRAHRRHIANHSSGDA